MKLKTTFILLVIGSVTLFCQPVSAQSPSFVEQDVIKQAGITTDAQIYALSVDNKQTTRVYIDGLGRTAQTIAVQASPAKRDIIQPMAYDNLGRQTTSYLPYAGQSTDVMGSYRANAISTDQPAFYNQLSQYLVAKDSSPYTQQVFENSPLQRMVSAGTVGKGFQPVTGQKFKTVEYRANTLLDSNIMLWKPGTTTGTYVTSAYYAISSLAVMDGKDEDGTETLSFTDLAGHLVLKREMLGSTRLDTYYIYNNAGMVAYIIPPLATNKLPSTSYSLTTAPVSNLVFHFVYDLHGRMIEKTVPSKGTMYVVYDPLNRPVLMQDANMLAKNQWNYIKYDSKNRVVCQGIYTDNTTTPTSHIGRANMQAYVNTIASSYNTTWYESRTATLTNNGYYTNVVFPIFASGTLTALAYSYYDDYDMNFDGVADFTYVMQGLPNEVGATTAQLKGVPTVVSIGVIGPGLSVSTWVTKATFYDKRGNPIQNQSGNHVYYLGRGVTDYKTVVPDFSGVPQISKVSKKTSAGSPTTVLTMFTYDHMYRVKAVSQQYNGSGTTLQVAEYTYNELGQVTRKGLGLNGATYLQGVDMRYSIRGQLLSINNSQLKNDTGKTNSDTNDLFGMQMLYDQTDSKLTTTPYYNGKLSAVKWMSKDGSGTSGYERAFRYYYDGLNRDTAAIYYERTGTGTFSLTHGWDENRITYDLNGNIKTLFRNSAQQGVSSGGHTPIDNLAYTYDTNNPNQLKSVTDGTGGSYNLAGFMIYAGGSSGNYNYDSNGNLASDPYKGIAHISYNVLNKSDTIRFSSTQYITYTYDAAGVLLRKQAYKTGTTTQLTDYVDGFVYNNSSGTEALAYFPMPEGRVRSDASGVHQEFIITDQQGNARISFDNSGTGGAAKVRQENSYYGFGMSMTNSTVGTLGDDNKNLYNGGSEWQNDFGDLPNYQQTHFRNYDPVLGRFAGVDPEPESAESLTTYQYAGNNPIMFNDPLGNFIQDPATATPPMAWAAEFSDEFNNSELADRAYALVNGSGSAYLWNSSGLGHNIYNKGSGVTSVADAVGAINAISGGEVGSEPPEDDDRGGTSYAEIRGQRYMQYNTWRDDFNDVTSSNDPAMELIIHFIPVREGGWNNGGGSGQHQHGFNIPAAVANLNANSLDHYEKNKCGKCAMHVRKAIEAGGINTANHPVAAKDYAPYLKDWGFKIISPKDYSADMGDIRVWQPYFGDKNNYGHIDMFNGKQWVSDFKENNFYPGRGYQDNNASYQIFRWPGK
ncbi:MAG TPA: DUF6443 domain-containing protein [Mucilaginibacter sp.]|nr:DUF6443 domain-containing protein [Mucilaginibacter sp.]